VIIRLNVRKIIIQRKVIIINLFERDISDSLTRLEDVMWGMRIPDSSYGKKPSACDFLVLNYGLLMGVECKMITDGSKSFPFDKISENQVEGLKRINDCGGKGLLLFNFRWMGSGKCKGKVFCIDILEFLYLEHALDRQSIPLDYFQQNTLELPKLELEEGYGWDLRVLK